MALVLGVSLFASGQVAGDSTQCKTYYTLAPLDAGALKLLSTPVFPERGNEFFNAAAKNIEKWDLPTEITPWDKRPSPQELASQWEELNRKFGRGPGVVRPYGLSPIPPNDWADTGKWFGPEVPKRISGACAGEGNGGRVLALGVVILGGGQAGNGASDLIQYQQSTTARRQDASVGANAATFNPVGVDNHADQMSGLGGSGAAAYTCVFVYRATGAVRASTPEYYYCKSSSSAPKSAVTAVLKYLEKN